MTMLIPLGVLGLGAVFSGMVWYSSFFGDGETVNRFFGIPELAVVAEADSSHGEGVGEAIEELAEGDAEEAGEAITEHVADEGEEGGEDIFAAAAPPGQGAIYMAGGYEVMDDAHHAPIWVKVSPFVAMLAGFLLAFQMYIRRPEQPAQLAANQPPLYRFLLNKWYFDEIYDAVFVRPARGLGTILWRRGDGDVIDGGINGVAMGIVPFLTKWAGRAQTGYMFTYVFAMVLGIAAILTWMTLTGGAG